MNMQREKPDATTVCIVEKSCIGRNGLDVDRDIVRIVLWKFFVFKVLYHGFILSLFFFRLKPNATS